MVTTFFQKAYDLFLKSLLPFSQKLTTFFQKAYYLFGEVKSCCFYQYLNAILTLLKHH